MAQPKLENSLVAVSVLFDASDWSKLILPSDGDAQLRQTIN